MFSDCSTAHIPAPAQRGKCSLSLSEGEEMLQAASARLTQLRDAPGEEVLSKDILNPESKPTQPMQPAHYPSPQTLRDACQPLVAVFYNFF